MSACTITPPPKPSARAAPGVTAPVTAQRAALERYRIALARRIMASNAEAVAPGRPQAMLRSLVVVSFTLDRAGRLVRASVYRTNGDDDAERNALASLRKAHPLPPPPAELLNRQGELEVMEDWLFNTDGRFQLRSVAAPQFELEQ